MKIRVVDRITCCISIRSRFRNGFRTILNAVPVIIIPIIEEYLSRRPHFVVILGSRSIDRAGVVAVDINIYADDFNRHGGRVGVLGVFAGGVVGEVIGEGIFASVAGVGGVLKTAVGVQGELPERGGGVELGGERLLFFFG